MRTTSPRRSGTCCGTASLCDEYGLDLQAVAEANIAKLRKRFPDGFSSADSIACVDAKD